MRVEAPEASNDVAEFVFGSDDPMPLGELAQSFLAIDRLFARVSPSGARLAITEIRRGSIVALLAPYLPMMGQVLSVANTAVEVGDFVKRTRDALNAFAGIETASVPSTVSAETAADLAELVRPLTGREGAELRVAHLKYRSETEGRTVEVEATYSSSELDRVAANTSREITRVQEWVALEQAGSDAPELLRNVVLTLHQANSGPAKEKGRTGDRAVVRSVSNDPLPVYFVKTVNDMKRGMVGRASNPLKSSFMVDVLVSREEGAAKSYTILDVHGPAKGRGSRKSSGMLPGF